MSRHDEFAQYGGRGRSGEERRIVRVLQIIQLIATDPGRWTRADLAERFDVAERNIQRDLTVIRRCLTLGLEREQPAGYYFVTEPGAGLLQAAASARLQE